LLYKQISGNSSTAQATLKDVVACITQLLTASKKKKELRRCRRKKKKQRKHACPLGL
jgi:hypothetical protein